MRGAMVLEVDAAGLEPTRRALARAVASGALGPGYRVVREGDGFVFDGGTGGRGRSDGPDGGRIAVTGDGRATWELRLRGAERLRVAQAVLLAALASVVGALAFGWFFFVALPVGGGVGALYAAAAIGGDRARARAAMRALVGSLPVLLDEPPRSP